MSEILVVGSLAYDSVETPSGKAEHALGGSANYFSIAASLYSKVRVVGVVGEDYSAKDLELLTSRGVDVSGLQKVPGKTFHWEGRYDKDLNEAITLRTELNVFEHFNPLLPLHYRDSRYVFLANIAPELQLQVLSQVEKPMLVGCDTMNFWIQIKKSVFEEVLKKVDVVLINEGEATLLTGANNAIEAAPKICEIGPEVVVIKRGEYGFAMYSKTEGFFILPAYPVAKVVDPTGAGDTFAGGFFGYLASLNRKPSWSDYKQASIVGTLLSSYTIEKFSVDRLKEITTELVSAKKSEYTKVFSI